METDPAYSLARWSTWCSKATRSYQDQTQTPNTNYYLLIVKVVVTAHIMQRLILNSKLDDDAFNYILICFLLGRDGLSCLVCVICVHV